MSARRKSSSEIDRGIARLVELIEGAPEKIEAILSGAERAATSYERARAAYKETHWGRPQTQIIKTRVVDPSAGPLVVLGELTDISYQTRKGREPVTIYTHDFGRTLPQLCFVPGVRRGGLVIAGGSYRVEGRGIVG